jgi:hypothetical protein
MIKTQREVTSSSSFSLHVTYGTKWVVAGGKEGEEEEEEEECEEED